jgi:hypothetical protein
MQGHQLGSIRPDGFHPLDSQCVGLTPDGPSEICGDTALSQGFKYGPDELSLVYNVNLWAYQQVEPGESQLILLFQQLIIKWAASETFGQHLF